MSFGPTGPPVAPRDGNHGPRVTAHDSLERDLHPQIEVRRDQRPAAVDYCPPVGLERVGRIIKLDAKQDPYKEIDRCGSTPT